MIYVVALALLLPLAFVFLSSASATKIVKDATTHQPETFTELYFTDYKTLPKQITAGTSYSGKFTIVNHEAKPTIYSYSVTVIENGQMTSTVTQKVTLRNGQAGIQAFSYAAANTKAQLEVVIQLIGKTQQIHYRALS